jgi:hypothetical protein
MPWDKVFINSKGIVTLKTSKDRGAEVPDPKSILYYKE